MTAAEIADLAQSDLPTTAIHEAGHVIVQLAVGLPFVQVSAMPVAWHDESLGGVMVTGERISIGDISGHMLNCVAGHVAEQLYGELECQGEFGTAAERADDAKLIMDVARRFGENGTAFPVPHRLSGWMTAGVPADGDGDDYSDAVYVANNFFPLYRFKSPLEFLRNAELRAAELLETHWPKVEAVANSLIRRRTHQMTFRQVCRLLRIDPANTRAAFPRRRQGTSV